MQLCRYAPSERTRTTAYPQCKCKFPKFQNIIECLKINSYHSFGISSEAKLLEEKLAINKQPIYSLPLRKFNYA